MNLYLIDYENVTDTGFLGVKELTADDTVIVFYSQHTKNISFERHIELSQSPAHFEYIKILKTGKNYLDFQLSTYRGFLIGKDKPKHIYIITNDTGYDSVIDFWSAKSIELSVRNPSCLRLLFLFRQISRRRWSSESKRQMPLQHRTHRSYQHQQHLSSRPHPEGKQRLLHLRIFRKHGGKKCGWQSNQISLHRAAILLSTVRSLEARIKQS